MAGVDYEGFDLLNVEVGAGIATTSIVAPPVNVMTLDLFIQLAKFSAAVAVDDDVKVVVLRSGDPDFFIAHFDVEAILQFPHDGEAARADELGGFHRMCETFRTMPKVTICEIDGRVGGGGNELAMSCDMRFGSIERCVINQMEVPLGLIPGGTGTQRLPRLVGRGRAMEIICGAVDIDAATADSWGLINRALPAVELRGHVDALAARIAAQPCGAIAAAKRSIVLEEDKPLGEALLDEAWIFAQTIRDPEARERMARFLEVGGQTRDGELDLQATIERLSD